MELCAIMALGSYGKNVEVDYRGAEVTVANFITVLTGARRQRWQFLHVLLSADDDDGSVQGATSQEHQRPRSSTRTRTATSLCVRVR